MCKGQEERESENETANLCLVSASISKDVSWAERETCRISGVGFFVAAGVLDPGSWWS